MIRKLLTAAAFACCVCAFASASAQVRDARPAGNALATPTGTGSLAGTVTAEGGRAIRNASVVLIGARTGVLKVTSSGADGGFTFSALPADRYVIGASKAPYLGAVAGARRPARPGTPIDLANGEKRAGVAIRLPAAGAITGTVYDENGQPASALVTAQQRKVQNGERVMVPVSGNFPTDERGQYRIYGLPPGDYVVSAVKNVSIITAARVVPESEIAEVLRGGLPPIVPPTSIQRPAPVYYPGSVRAEDAQLISVGSGDERLADIRLESSQMARIDGSITLPDGPTPRSMNVVLYSGVNAGPFGFAMGGRVGPDGRFTIPSVAPGGYILEAVATMPSGELFIATQRIEMNGVDMAGLQLTPRPPLSIAGRFVSTTGAALPGLTLPVTLIGTGVPAGVGGPGLRPTVTPANAQGAFTIRDMMPGRYVFGGAMTFGPSTDTTTWALQSVVADGKDITDTAIDVTPETLPKEIVATLTDQWQNVSGRLLDGAGAPATDYVVVVFPADKTMWLHGSRRVATARPDTSGRFTLGGSGILALPSGDYLLAAVTDLGKDEQYDPALLTQLAAAAVPFTLAPGEKKTQDLVIR